MENNIAELDAIIGKDFNYKGKNITIEKYKRVGGNVVVFAPGPLNFFESEIPFFIEMLQPTADKPNQLATQNARPKTQGPLMINYEPSAENAEIKLTLMETLRKVKADPSYIPQAKAVTEVVRSLVDIQKNEIQFLNVMNKMM